MSYNANGGNLGYCGVEQGIVLLAQLLASTKKSLSTQTSVSLQEIQCEINTLLYLLRRHWANMVSYTAVYSTWPSQQGL